MKTFEEACKRIYFKGTDQNARTRHMVDVYSRSRELRKEIADSGELDDMIAQYARELLSKSMNFEDVAYSAFTCGLLVGIEMEKE